MTNAQTKAYGTYENYYQGNEGQYDRDQDDQEEDDDNDVSTPKSFSHFILQDGLGRLGTRGGPT